MKKSFLRDKKSWSRSGKTRSWLLIKRIQLHVWQLHQCCPVDKCPTGPVDQRVLHQKQCDVKHTVQNKWLWKVQKIHAYMQCRWWVLPCPSLIPFPQADQGFTTLTNQPVNHQAVCTPLAPEKTRVSAFSQLRPSFPLNVRFYCIWTQTTHLASLTSSSLRMV